MLGYGPGDVILGSAPFSHVLGQSAGMNAALLAGARLAVPRRFDSPRTLLEMAETGTTVLLGVPTMCVAPTAAAGESAIRASRFGSPTSVARRCPMACAGHSRRRSAARSTRVTA